MKFLASLLYFRQLIAWFCRRCYLLLPSIKKEKRKIGELDTVRVKSAYER
ncbi:hypothetical protein MTR67_005276 [Solanum verrucosum]|uniref:Uncharacterized protein n=1 Tax=Solanum verrucosum TaxID=315347 RepID=A0AAF0Q0I2_SOLVR|nr:hypothetical protein MTR67_005276 [Solanum verrucosum]